MDAGISCVSKKVRFHDSSPASVWDESVPKRSLLESETKDARDFLVRSAR
jgi:hypothetical protein